MPGLTGLAVPLHAPMARRIHRDHGEAWIRSAPGDAVAARWRRPAAKPAAMAHGQSSDRARPAVQSQLFRISVGAYVTARAIATARAGRASTTIHSATALMITQNPIDVSAASASSSGVCG